MMGGTPAKRRLGRPKDEAKRAAILAAARAQFFRYGPAGVTIDAVAAEAGVSRMTVYGHFQDKETLFSAVVAAQAASVGRALSDLSVKFNESTGCTSEEFIDALISFGESLVGFLVQPEVRSFNRLMELAARDHPKLARIWIENGPSKVFQDLVRRLEAGRDAGFIAIPDGPKAARTLTSLFRGVETLSSGAGLSPPPTPTEISAHVRECVMFFLRGYSRS